MSLILFLALLLQGIGGAGGGFGGAGGGLGSGTSAPVSISYIANAGGTGSAGTGTTSTSLNVTAGDTLIVFCKTGGANNTISMSDTLGNSFSKGTHQNDPSIGNSDMFYAVSTGSNAADFFTCTNSNSANFIALVALQYRGGVSSGIADVLTNGSGASGAWTTASFSTAAANEVVVQCVAASVSPTAGLIGGVTPTMRYNTGNVACQDVIFSSTQSSITAKITLPGTGNYNGQMGAFK